MPGVYVAPSVWRDIDVRTMSSIMAAIQSNPNPDDTVIWEPLWNDALLARSRSLLVTKWLENHSDSDVMVIIDSDVVFEPDDFWKIVEGARETKSIYGGVYVTRSTKPHISSRFLPNTEVRIEYTPHRRPLELEYLATGFWAMHRDVVEAMLEGEFRDADGTHRIHRCLHGANQPFWPFFATFTIEERPGLFHYLSEDWAFCERARQLGFKIWMDQSIILAHMGWYPFTVGDMERPDPGLPSTGTDYIESVGRDESWHDPIVDDLIADIAEYAEENEGDVRRMVAIGPVKTAEMWNSKPPGQTEGEWYAREDVGFAYMADLANWHTRGGGHWWKCAVEWNGKRVLDYGSGIGTATLGVLRYGAHVTAYDISPIMREFTVMRAQKHGVGRNLLMLERNPLELPDESRFDVIAAWHVFEHLDDPEAVLDALLARLVPGGVLVTESGFADRLTPQHHEHADWSGALVSRGLVNVAPGVFRVATEEGAGSGAGIAASAPTSLPVPSTAGVPG
jgi:SAM-dependent methyltransferase